MSDIRFAVFTDLHHDHVFDSYERLGKVVNKIKHLNVDFVLNLGDFCKPVESNKKVLELLKDIGKPCYHAIGNHDSDVYPKEQVLKFLNLERSYYSFVKGNVKIIVLDTCFIEENGEFKAYNKRNYSTTDGKYPVLPKEQLEWLKEELCDETLKYVIVSHHSLENEFKKRGVCNREEVQNVINESNVNGKKVIMCINGHDHADSINEICDTHYFGVNGMSYIWFGELVNQRPYSEELYEQFPWLKDIVLYKDGLHAIVTIKDSGGFEIEGMTSDYKTVTPEEMGIEGLWNGKPITPNITSVKVG